MADVTLKVLTCPSCGARLKAENANDPIVCVYCGNTIIPTQNNISGNINSGASFRIDGIKNSLSALAYLDSFFDSYDWESFSYTPDISVKEIDELTQSMLVTSANEKDTWILAFLSTYIPYEKKVTLCNTVLNSIVSDFENDNLDAYSRFDSYNRIVGLLYESRGRVVAFLEKSIANAKKHGASGAELSDMNTKLDGIRNIAFPVAYNSIEDIPEIREYIDKTNERIASELYNEGIDAEHEYSLALSYIEANEYVKALDILTTLRGYRDSQRLIKKVGNCFWMNDVIEIAGSLYYLKKGAGEQATYHLYPSVGKKISNKPILTNIVKIVANYANILYYIDSQSKLKRYDLLTGNFARIYKSFDAKSVFTHGETVYIVAKSTSEKSAGVVGLVTLNLNDGDTKLILNDIQKVFMISEGKIVYSKKSKDGKSIIKVSDLAGENVIEIGEKVSVECIVGETIVYTKPSPNKYNKDLYTISQNNNACLLEKNIYKFEGFFAGKLFYYVGSARYASLINCNIDGTERKEMPSYVSKVVVDIGEYIYFIRKAGYNSVLCKARMDGSGFCIISDDIAEFVALKHGYMYYLDGLSRLLRVRMDGTNRQQLCEHVESVLFVDDNKVVFVSSDGQIKESAGDITRKVKSIYQIDLLGEGKRKLAYDVKYSKKYDEGIVYYIADARKEAGGKVEVLFRLDISTGEITKLLEFEISEEKGHGCLISLLIFISTIILVFVGAMSQTPGLVIIATLGILMSAIFGLRELYKGDK